MKDVTGPAGSADEVDPRNYVASVIKSCNVVEVLGGGDSEYSLGEIAAATGIGKSTVHRLLSSLQMAGWVERGPRDGYRLSIRMLKLAHASQRQFSIRNEALPHLRSLAGHFGDTAFLLVPSDEGAVVVEMVEGESPLKVNTVTLGTVLPYHVAGGPTVMAAWDDTIRERVLSAPRKRYTDKTDVTRDALETKFARIREQGYVFADEDLNNGVAVVSAPVFGPTGALSCTLSLGGAAQGFGPDRLDHIVTAVREACAALSERLGAPAPR
ncbi:IclR family transcriptional regulator [Cytobacillus oceanisediminis]